MLLFAPWDLLQLTLMLLAVVLAVLALELPCLVHGVMALCGMFVSLGVLYWTLHAPYVALLQLLVYAGAVIALSLAVVTLARRGPREG